MRSKRFGLFGTLVCLFWLCAPAAFAQTADLGVIKLGPSTAGVGNNVPITYSLSVTNAGPNDAAGVSLTDALPPGMVFTSIVQNSGPTFSCTTPVVGTGGTVSCALASMSSGLSATFTLVAAISTASPGDFYQNTATISSDTLDPNIENNSYPAGTQIPAPSADVFVTKAGPSGASANSDVTYTITVGNAGPDNAASVQLSDTLPGGLTFVSLTQNSGPVFSCPTPGATTVCTIASLPSGASATFTLVAHVPAGTASGSSFTNAASVQSSTNDPSPDNNSASTTLVVSSVDVSAGKTAPATVTAGQNLSYSLTLSNAGPDAASQARLLDTLPPNTSFVSVTQNTGPAASCLQLSINQISCAVTALASGASATFTLVANVAGNTPNGTVLTNTATASTASFDTNATNDSASASTTVQNTADLSITKSGPPTVVAGSNASYTLTIANAGPDVAGSPSFSDTLPAGTSFVSIAQNSGPLFNCTAGATVTCTRPSGLAAGTSASFTLVAAISNSLANGSTVSNTAIASSSGAPDPASANNSSTSSATVGASADLAVTKTASYGGAVGGNIVYTLGVLNNGPSAASAVQLLDTLPAGTRFVSLSQSGGPAFNCATPAVGTGGAINCVSATLAVGATATFVLTVDTAAAPLGATIVNTAGVTSPTSDPVPANNAASASVTLSAQPAAPTPALNWVGLLLLAALLLIVAMWRRADFQR